MLKLSKSQKAASVIMVVLLLGAGSYAAWMYFVERPKSIDARYDTYKQEQFDRLPTCDETKNIDAVKSIECRTADGGTDWLGDH